MTQRPSRIGNGLRHGMARLAVIAALTLAGAPVQADADTATPALAALQPVLPPLAAVRQTLDTHPALQAGTFALAASTAERRRLEAGPHEWTWRMLSQQRRSTSPGGPEQTFQEWNSALERPLRLPGKARVDAALGAAGESAARLAAGDVGHETRRDLLARWFEWLREATAEAQWTAHSALLAQQQAALIRREQLGDAARLERVQGEAALAQAEAQRIQAEQRQRAAATLLQRRYPGIPLVLPNPLPEPPPFTGDDEHWLAQLLEHNHELALAGAEAQRAALGAERSRLERIPDPTLGLQLGRERGGEEKLAGLYVSIPLPGAARSATADAAQAHAAAAERQQAQVRRRVEAEAASLLQELRQAEGRWRASQRAAQGQQTVATMNERAWQLGEGTHAEWLMARRLANEAVLNARLAQLDALEKHARLLLDAHLLWDFDEPGAQSDTP